MALNQLVALDTGADAFGNAFNTTGNALVNRQTNMLRQQQLDMQNQKQSIDIQNQQRLQQLRPELVKGNPDALAEAGINNPEFLDKWTKLTNDQRQQKLAENNIVANAAYNARNPQEWDASVQNLVQTGIIPPETAQKYMGRFDLRQSVIAQNQDLLKRLPLNTAGTPMLPGGAPSQAAPSLQYGQGGTAPSSGITSSPAPQGSVSDRIIGVESGGNPNAQNPNSSASGLGQFTDGTWLQTVKAHMPMAKGMSDDEILQLKGDPNLQRQAVGWLAEDNGNALTKAGVPVNDANLYLAHFAGADGATKLLKADPSTPISQVLSKDAVAANANVKFGGKFFPQMTAGDLQQWAAAKMGVDQAQPQKPIQTADLSGTTGFQAAANQQAQQSPQQVANLPDNTIMEMGDHGPRPRPAPDNMVWVQTPQGPALTAIPGLAKMKGQQEGQTLTETRKAEAGTPQYLAQLENEDANSFRSQRVVQERNEAGTNYRAVMDVAKQRTPAGDEALAKYAARVFDPSAGPNLDAASIMQLQGVGAKVGGVLSKALGGSGLGDAERDQLLQAIQSKMASLEGGYQQEVKYYTDRARSRGLNVQNIIPDMPVQQSGQQVQYPVPKPAETKTAKTAAAAPAPTTAAAAPQPAPEMPSGLPGANETPAPQSAFSSMSDADLGKIDKTKMQPDARRQYEDEVLKRRAAIIPTDAVEAELRRRGAIK